MAGTFTILGELHCSVDFKNEHKNAGEVLHEPLIIRITPARKLRTHVFWVLPLPLLLLRENRNLKALWALLPLFAWLGLACCLREVRMESYFSRIWLGKILTAIPPLPVFLCGLLLAGKRIGKSNGWIVLAAAVILGAFILAVWVFIYKVEQPEYFVLSGAAIICLILLSVILANLCCRGAYRPVRLTVTAILSTLLLSIPALGGMEFIYFHRFPFTTIIEIVQRHIPLFISTGAAAAMILLSFLLTAFCNEPSRHRLCSLLKLQPRPPKPPASNQSSYPATQP